MKVVSQKRNDFCLDIEIVRSIEKLAKMSQFRLMSVLGRVSVFIKPNYWLLSALLALGSRILADRLSANEDSPKIWRAMLQTSELYPI
jgi:hypothetical protein